MEHVTEYNFINTTPSPSAAEPFNRAQKWVPGCAVKVNRSSEACRVERKVYQKSTPNLFWWRDSIIPDMSCGWKDNGNLNASPCVPWRPGPARLDMSSSYRLDGMVNFSQIFNERQSCMCRFLALDIHYIKAVKWFFFPIWMIFWTCVIIDTRVYFI